MRDRDVWNRLINESPEIRRLLTDLQQGSAKMESDAAKADPTAHKLSRVFEPHPRYRYFEARNGRGQRVRFAWSTNRNVAGYFLGWREVITKKGEGGRDSWTASRTRGRVKEIALRRYNALKGDTP